MMGMRQRYLLGVAMGLVCWGCYPDPEVVELTGEDNGRDMMVSFHQEVHVTLQTIGPGQFGKPVVSSAAVEFEGMSFAAVQNPGGPTQLYEFRTVDNGAAVVTIPHDSGSAPFTVTLRCCPQ